MILPGHLASFNKVCLMDSPFEYLLRILVQLCISVLDKKHNALQASTMRKFNVQSRGPVVCSKNKQYKAKQNRCPYTLKHTALTVFLH